LDEFKAINDRFGHPAGDVVLKVFARTLETHLRGSDFAGRYGGDEFIVAFPHTPLHGAVESMERIRRVMASTPLRTSDGLEFSASCTIGIAEARNNMRMETLINAADKELYRAKELGRNRVCAAGIEY
jgi:diguanylate cyclase (GGDEF)-like protein